MKKIALAAALSVAATSAFAGAHGGSKFAEPVIEPAVVVEETRAGSGGIIVPLMLLLVVAAGIAASR
ncbi:MAG: hypothetical protein ACXIU7_06315 [Roseinatronobacter sp.]